MNSIIRTGLVACFLVAFSFSASSAELLLSGSKSQSTAKKGENSFAIDVVSDGDIRGFDFSIAVPKKAKINTSRCLSDLPAGFQGVCKYNENEGVVLGAVIATDKISLPSGVHSVGYISVSSRIASEVKALEFVAADVNGDILKSGIVTSID